MRDLWTKPIAAPLAPFGSVFDYAHAIVSRQSLGGEPLPRKNGNLNPGEQSKHEFVSPIDRDCASLEFFASKALKRLREIHCKQSGKAERVDKISERSEQKFVDQSDAHPLSP